MVIKKHGIIIETPSEARQAERGTVDSASPDGKPDRGRDWNGLGVVHFLPHIEISQARSHAGDRKWDQYRTDEVASDIGGAAGVGHDNRA
jgi:hypothetical protein